MMQITLLYWRTIKPEIIIIIIWMYECSFDAYEFYCSIVVVSDSFMEK